MLKEKRKLIAKGKEYLELKCTEIRKEIEAIEESAANETKSSMGDKYETGREMMMQERQKQYDQLDVMSRHLSQLSAIDIRRAFEKGQAGSLVTTDQGTFFISVALGKVREVDPQVFFVSPIAPLSKAIMGKHEGERFEINGRNYEIKQIC